METIRASEEAAARRGATLEAVAFAAQRLLEEPDWQQVIPDLEVNARYLTLDQAGTTPVSPGMLLKHYSPTAELRL